MGNADEGHGPDGLDDRPPLRDRLREAWPEQAPFQAHHRSFRQAKAQRAAAESVLGWGRRGGYMRPPVPRFTVVTLGVTDMRASIAFYEALGFARKFRATGEAVAFFDTGATVIGLFPWDELARDAALPET